MCLLVLRLIDCFHLRSQFVISKGCRFKINPPRRNYTRWSPRLFRYQYIYSICCLSTLSKTCFLQPNRFRPRIYIRLCWHQRPRNSCSSWCCSRSWSLRCRFLRPIRFKCQCFDWAWRTWFLSLALSWWFRFKGSGFRGRCCISRSRRLAWCRGSRWFPKRWCWITCPSLSLIL